MNISELLYLNSILSKAGITSLHDTLCILGTGACEYGIRWTELDLWEEEKKYKKLCDQIDKALGFSDLDNLFKKED